MDQCGSELPWTVEQAQKQPRRHTDTQRWCCSQMTWTRLEWVQDIFESAIVCVRRYPDVTSGTRGQKLLWFLPTRTTWFLFTLRPKTHTILTETHVPPSSSLLHPFDEPPPPTFDPASVAQKKLLIEKIMCRTQESRQATVRGQS